MRSMKSLLALSVLLAAPAAFAATTTPTATVNKEFVKVSQDGATAIRDVQMARIAIFNGQTEKAKALTDQAKAEIAKAAPDNTAFNKAEADLKAPAGVQQPGNDANRDRVATQWIPIDGSVVFADNYAEKPENAAALKKANQQLKVGKTAAATNTLQLTNADVLVTMQVAPLKTTTAAIDQADTLIHNNQFFEASQQLRTVDQNLRFDVADTQVTPTMANTHNTGAAGNNAVGTPAHTNAKE